VAKIGILLAYFELHPAAATDLAPETRHELGLMAEISSNKMAAKLSQEMGLKKIQQVINAYHLCDTNHGGGLWVGKHNGKGTERYGDPIGDNSQAPTVRQLFRFDRWLEQGKLMSSTAPNTMREIFASPDTPHDEIKFVKGLAGRDAQVIRKWGRGRTDGTTRRRSTDLSGIISSWHLPNIPKETSISLISPQRLTTC